MQQPGDYSTQPAGSAATSDTGRPGRQSAGSASEVVAVPVFALRPADSPRLNGEDKAHIARLAETETPLPPILVDRRTMRVIDGMHRLMAASLQGRETIEVIFFDGKEADVFLHAVTENVTHGLPLSHADRRAAAKRIIASHPHLSDRAIGQSTGLAAKTVAAIRRSSSDNVPQSNARVGRDGRVRPLDSGQGRRRAAELLAERPTASLRDVARAAGISPATVLDVRKRLERGESPVPGKRAANGTAANGTAANGTAANGTAANGTAANGPAANGPAANGPAGNGTAANGTTSRTAEGHEDNRGGAVPATRFGTPGASRPTAAKDPAATVEKLLRDPSLRGSEQGKGMLRLLHVNAIGAGQLNGVVPAVPPHCVGIVLSLARHYATMWQDFALELDGRARIINPPAASRWT